MNCYLHALEARVVPAVAICRHRGVALCLDHLEDFHEARKGGMVMGCAHLEVPRTAARAAAR